MRPIKSPTEGLFVLIVPSSFAKASPLTAAQIFIFKLEIHPASGLAPSLQYPIKWRPVVRKGPTQLYSS
ncbi:Bgt-20035 [Blumeria graminis f. sp. tritici]|uniref:Bgt-20035 n=2 Tax=Blumeria graminis f. sp. tritici TaxID=62690 RepID=A0A9X9MNG7_BLUGR|nr:Bgt-20035 [Blumeria graminis f. sp. tritici]